MQCWVPRCPAIAAAHDVRIGRSRLIVGRDVFTRGTIVGQAKNAQPARLHASKKIVERDEQVVSRHFPDGWGPSPSPGLDTALLPSEARIFRLLGGERGPRPPPRDSGSSSGGCRPDDGTPRTHAGRSATPGRLPLHASSVTKPSWRIAVDRLRIGSDPTPRRQNGRCMNGCFAP